MWRLAVIGGKSTQKSAGKATVPAARAYRANAPAVAGASSRPQVPHSRLLQLSGLLVYIFQAHTLLQLLHRLRALTM